LREAYLASGGVCFLPFYSLNFYLALLLRQALDSTQRLTLANLFESDMSSASPSHKPLTTALAIVLNQSQDPETVVQANSLAGQQSCRPMVAEAYWPFSAFLLYSSS